MKDNCKLIAILMQYTVYIIKYKFKEKEKIPIILAF